MKVFTKRLIQNILSRIPLGERINLWMQMNVTKGLPVSEEGIISKIDAAKFHISNYLSYNKDKNTDLSKISSFEFGAGYDLIVPLIFSFMNINKIYCVDIKYKISAFLINDIIERLKINTEFMDLISESKLNPEITPSNLTKILEEKYNIYYKAPMDAASTNFPDESIDLIVSNATLEHIPKDSIKRILKESYRILKPGGVLSHSIDYKDHWAYTDSTLSYYNFLQYSEKEWKYRNPDLNYQNRLRHRDYEELFIDAGFKIVKKEPFLPLEKDKAALRNLNIHESFKSNYTFEELSILSSFFAITK